MKQFLLITLFLYPICICSQIPNDNCDDAETLPEWDAMNITSATMDGENATISGVSPSCQTNPADGWYSFTMPFNGNVLVDGTPNCEMAIYLSDLEICYDLNLFCDDLNDKHAFNLVSGQEYKVQVWRAIGTPSPIDFSLLATPLITNDNCELAEALPAWDADDSTFASFNTNGATSSGLNPSCGGLSRDGWFSFTMPYDGNLFINGTPNCRMAIYTEDAGECIGAEVYCDDLNSKHAFNLVGGENYLVQAYRVLGTDGVLSFSLQTTPIIINDECLSAEAMPDWDSNNESSISYNSNGATPSPDPNPSCEINSIRDAWYTFTMPFNGQLFLTGDANVEIVIYPASAVDCYDASTEIYCGTVATLHAFDLLEDQDYILRSYRALGTDGQASLTLEAVPVIPNDECNTATEMVFAPDFTSVNTFDTNGASPSPDPDPTCETNPRDGWYIFESPINGFYEVTGSTNVEYAIYDICGGTEIDCGVFGLSFPVVQGESYVIRAYRRLGTDGPMNVNLIPTIVPVAAGIMGDCEAIPSVVINESNNNKWVNIVDAAGSVVASVKANGQDLGVLTCNLEIDADDVRLFSSDDVPYLRREVEISPEIAPTAPVDVRIYMLGDELLDLILVDDNVSEVSDLKLNKAEVAGCSGGLPLEYITLGLDKSGNYDTEDYFIEAQVESFSTFYPGNIVIILPVELSSFTGSAQFNHNLIEWETAAEINTDRFVIERSQKGTSWEEIGERAASGNTTTKRNYSFVDTNMPAFAYYRLVILDRDGSMEYSAVINIINNKADKLQYYPNPVHDLFYIRSHQNIQMNKFEIYNLSGQLLKTEISSVSGIIEVDVQDLDQGVYLIKVYTEDGIESQMLHKI